MMFKKILFATSATPAGDHAARVAFELANRFDAHVSIFHVLGVPSRGFSQTVVDVRTGENVVLDDDYKSWVKEEIQTYYENQLKDYKASNVLIEVGFPHREILRYARENKPDLIVLGGSTDENDDSVYKRHIAGTTLQRITKSAPCPVLIVNRPAASFWGGISSIVFGTDFSAASDVSFQYANKIASRIDDGELHIFHAVDISNIHSSLAMSQDKIEETLRLARNKIRSKYVSQLEGFKNYSIDVWEGLPYVEIVKYAREKQADLIIMSHQAKDVDDDNARLGSNMEQVIMRATCPVISINRHTAGLVE
jgi:nucleotide-binding universal stress UspA family protein